MEKNKFIFINLPAWLNNEHVTEQMNIYGAVPCAGGSEIDWISSLDRAASWLHHIFREFKAEKAFQVKNPYELMSYYFRNPEYYVLAAVVMYAALL